LRSLFLSIKKRALLIVSIILLFLSVFFSYTMFNSLGYFNLNKQTIVGTIYLENIEEFQYASFISNKVNEWKNKSTYKVIYQEYSLDMNLSYFDLDIDRTINDIQESKTNKVRFNISDESKTILLNEFIDTFSVDIINSFNYDLFLDNLISHLEDMNIFKIYNLENFLDSSLSETIIDSVTISNVETSDVNNITSLLDELIITNNDRFSIIEKCNDLPLNNNQLSILASGIERITEKTPFSGYIFNQNHDSLGWNEEGLNVLILKTNNYDFSFYNPLDFDYTIKITKASNTSITFELIGYPFANKYTITKTDETILAYPTLYYDNELLNASTENVIVIDTDTETIYHLVEQAGVDGRVVTFTRNTTKPDSSTESEIIYREIYFPTPEIIQENIIPKDGN